MDVEAGWKEVGRDVRYCSAAHGLEGERRNEAD